jgi:hypothetical protein
MKYVAVLVVVVSLLIGAGFNLYAEDSAVRGLAELAACGSVFCSKRVQVKVERSITEERIEFALPSGDVAVKCARAAVLFGSYTCEKEQ